MRQLLCIGFLAFVCTFTQAQNVGVNMPTPTENLHVDSIIKVGKNAPLNQQARKNLLKFGDGSYVSIGEEVADDKLYIRYGDLSFMKSSGSVGSGFIGINTETPSAYLDVAGTFRLRGNGAAAGKVLVSDADGNATWQTQSFTLPFSGSTDGGMIALNISNTGSSFTTFTGIKGTAINGVVGETTSASGFGVTGTSSSSGTGVKGNSSSGRGISGASISGSAVYGMATTASGISGHFESFGGSKALVTSGPVQLNNIGAGAGKVLTSDASGNATWQAPAGPSGAFSARLTNNITLASGAVVAITSYTEEFDDGNDFNPATGEFTPPSAGVYQFTFNLNFSESGTAEKFVTVYVNRSGSVFKAYSFILSGTSSNYASNVTATFIVKLPTADPISLSVTREQSGGSTLRGGSFANTTSFSGYRLY